MRKNQLDKINQQIDEIVKAVTNVQNLLGMIEAEKEVKNEKLGSVFDCLAVTNVQIYPFKEGTSLGNLKGLASIVLNDQFLVRGLRIMDGENGLYVGYPNDPFYKGEDFKSICNPITRQLREHIETCVLEKYQAAIA